MLEYRTKKSTKFFPKKIHEGKTCKIYVSISYASSWSEQMLFLSFSLVCFEHHLWKFLWFIAAIFYILKKEINIFYIQIFMEKVLDGKLFYRRFITRWKHSNIEYGF
jgi:hypothetical protein